MSRTYQYHAGTCTACGRVPDCGALWVSLYSRPLDLGTEGLAECDMSVPPLCEACETLRKLADPWYRRQCPSAERWETEAIADGGVRM